MLLWYIDDSADDRFLVNSMLEELNLPDLEIEMFAFAKEALGRLEDGAVQSPDLILLDLNMPGMDGHEFLEGVGQGVKEPPRIVVLSSTNSPEEGERALKGGAQRVVQKPFELQAYQDVLKQVIHDYSPQNLAR